jgi:phosphopantetheine--protein transferase-like protein
MENKISASVKALESDKFAVGNDLVYLPDFKLSLTELFKKKVYTTAETEYCELFDDSVLRYASTWAAKEAVYKAVKQLESAAIPLKKIEILREKPGGRPFVALHKHNGRFKISLTISHDGDYIWAVALIEINP